MFLLHLGSRRQVTHLLRNNLNSTEIFGLLFGVKSFPHGDTLDKVFRCLDPQQFQEVVCDMTETLIRGKVLYPYRLLDKYFVVAVNGTGQLSFNQRHCPHCLTRTHSNGQTTYYHYVLEAKLVTRNGFAFSMMTEFVENPGENPVKQDCELKAFYRLAERLKKRFPRLPILLTLDGLFAGGPTFEVCRKNGWAFMIVLKDKDLPTVNSEFEALRKQKTQNKLKLRLGSGREIEQNYCWVDDIIYVDSGKGEHNLSVIQCLESKPDKNQKQKTKKFNMIFQLLERGSLIRKRFPKGFGSAKNLASLLLEAWRNCRLTQEEWQAMQMKTFQIRFDSS